MTAAAAGEVYQVLVQGILEGQVTENVLYFKTAQGSDSVENDLLKALLSCFMTHMMPVMPKNYVFNGVFGMRVTPDVGPPLQAVPEEGATIAGDEDIEPMPSYVSALVSIQASRGGRSGKGRFYLPGVPKAACIASNLNPEHAFWIAVGAYVACIVSKFMITNEFAPIPEWQIGVMSRKFGGLKPPFIVEGFAPALAITPKLPLSTTRSRKVGHGS